MLEDEADRPAHVAALVLDVEDLTFANLEGDALHGLDRVSGQPRRTAGPGSLAPAYIGGSGAACGGGSSVAVAGDPGPRRTGPVHHSQTTTVVAIAPSIT